jgi:uncharacterized membrane protein
MRDIDKLGGQRKHPASKLPPPMSSTRISGHRHPANIARHDDLTAADRIPDRLTNGIGTMKFIYWSAVVIALWATLNTTGLFVWHWDPYPFVFLNLGFSAFAYFSAPLILMSQNRQTEHDRARAECDYEINERDAEVNRKALAEIQQNTSVTQATAARIEKIVTHLGIEETS